MRWDPAQRRYLPHELPAGCPLSAGPGERVSCASCGDWVPYDGTLASLEIHEPLLGLGYPVCPACHAAEVSRRQAADAARRHA